MSEPQVQLIDEAWLAATATDICSRIATDTGPVRRFILGIAGIPGAGKSTLAARLAQTINRITPDSARLVSMDGFHLTNRQLEERGLRQRKGSPETFDFENYFYLLHQAKQEVSSSIVFPIYDRSLHEPVTPGDEAHTITSATRIVITEGNYLLLREPPWSSLAQWLDECWFLDSPMELAKQWILARHIRGGRSAESAAAHFERSDEKNARLVLEQMRTPSRVLRWP